MKKSLLIISACLVCVIGFQAFTMTRPPEFRNLKILPQDISKEGLDSVMHTFTVSLGVRCNFCHVRNEAERSMDFASDAKPEKNIARKMMMMSIMLNKNYFKAMGDHDMDHDMDDSSHDAAMANMNVTIDTTTTPDDYRQLFRTITCYTCHRGDPHPDSKIPVMPPPPPPKQPAGDKSGS